MNFLLIKLDPKNTHIIFVTWEFSCFLFPVFFFMFTQWSDHYIINYKTLY